MRLAWVLLFALVTGSAVADEATERALANNRARMADIDVACKKLYSDPALEPLIGKIPIWSNDDAGVTDAMLKIDTTPSADENAALRIYLNIAKECRRRRIDASNVFAKEIGVESDSKAEKLVQSKFGDLVDRYLNDLQLLIDGKMTFAEYNANLEDAKRKLLDLAKRPYVEPFTLTCTVEAGGQQNEVVLQVDPNLPSVNGNAAAISDAQISWTYASDNRQFRSVVNRYTGGIHVFGVTNPTMQMNGNCQLAGARKF